jgi:hypothetical protein
MALENPDHERFCQAAHTRIWAGEKAVEACEAAYRETILEPGAATSGTAFSANVRKLRNLPAVKARLQQLADHAAKLAGIDAGWALVELKRELDAIGSFNLDDFLSKPDERGRRYIDLNKVPREQLALLTEMTTRDTKYGAEIKIKGPNRYSDKPNIISLMAKIAGWLAPERQEHNVGPGLEQLIAQSMQPIDPQSIMSLDQAIMAYRAGRLTKQQADELAIARGWGHK